MTKSKKTCHTCQTFTLKWNQEKQRTSDVKKRLPQDTHYINELGSTTGQSCQNSFSLIGYHKYLTPCQIPKTTISLLPTFFLAINLLRHVSDIQKIIAKRVPSVILVKRYSKYNGERSDFSPTCHQKIKKV